LRKEKCNKLYIKVLLREFIWQIPNVSLHTLLVSVLKWLHGKGFFLKGTSHWNNYDCIGA